MSEENEENKKAVGYARVSTKNQDLKPQVEKLKKFLRNNYNDFDVFKEKVSSIKEREQLDRIFDNLDKYDVLIVTKLDRFARSMKDFIVRQEDLEKNNVDFKTIDQPIDTKGKYGELMKNMLMVIAEFERNMIRERMNERYREAQEDGRIGRKKKIQNKALEDFKEWYKNGNTVAQIQALLDYNHDIEVSKQTIYRYLDNLDLRERRN